MPGFEGLPFIIATFLLTKGFELLLLMFYHAALPFYHVLRCYDRSKGGALTYLSSDTQNLFDGRPCALLFFFLDGERQGKSTLRFHGTLLSFRTGEVI